MFNKVISSSEVIKELSIKFPSFNTENNVNSNYIEKHATYNNYRYFPESMGDFYQTISPFFKFSIPQSILDFGCSRGYLVRWISKNEPQHKIIGVDIDTTAIQKGKEEAQTEEKIDIPINSISNPFDIINYDTYFNVVIVRDVLEHMSLNELAISLETFRVSSNSMYFSVPITHEDGGLYIQDRANADDTHLIKLTKNTWGQILSSFGKIEEFPSNIYQRIRQPKGYNVQHSIFPQTHFIGKLHFRSD